MNAQVKYKGENMHATLSFAYPEDEQEFKDALLGTKYKLALKKIQDRIAEMYKYDDDSEFVVVSIKTIVDLALKEEL